MNIRSLLVRLVAAITLAFALTAGQLGAQLIGYDTAANYSGVTTGTNGGTGFGPWTVTANSGSNFFAGIFVGNPGSAGITGLANPSFGMYANPAGLGAAVFASRSFSNALTTNQTFSVKWAVNWDADTGGKGFRIFSGGTNGIQLAQVRQGGFPGDITFQGATNSASANAITNYGNGPMTWSFKMTTPTTLEVTSTPRDGSTNIAFTTNLTVAAAPDSVVFYATNMTTSDNRQPYFNDLLIFSGEQPPVTAPITFSVNMNYQISTGAFVPGSDKVSVDWGTGFPPSNFEYLTDADNDGIYTGTASITDTVGANVPYRFTIEPANPQAPLVSETVSRSLTMPASATTVPTVFFNNIQGQRDVTFTVNMSVQEALANFNPTTGQVRVQGAWNGWSTPTTLTPQGSGLYSGTIPISGLASQAFEYKFINTTTNAPNGGYENDPNRSLNLEFNVGGSATPAQVLPTVFFNRQDVVPNVRPVTLSVNMNYQITQGAFSAATDSVQVRGLNGAWGGGSTWVLTDGDNDGIYTGTFNIEGTEGSTQEYKFWRSTPNTPNGGYENDPNRSLVLGPNTTPQTVPTVFFNNQSGQTRDVTFSVDMSIQQAKGLFNPATGTVELRGLGSFNAGDAKPLTRVGTTSVYTGSFAVAGDAGTSFAYKFFSAGVTDSGFEILNPNDLFQNRTATLGASETPQVLSLAYFSNQLFYTTGAAPNPFSTTQGIASAAQSLTINGQGLTADIVATAPTGYEVSADGITYGTTANLVPASGAVTGTNNLFVRIAASAAVGSPSGNVSLTSTGSQSVSIAVSGTVTASGQTFANWSGGLSNTPTLQLQYAIGGASSPTATNGVPSVTTVTSNALAITAIVRTNDPNLSVVGQAVIDLSAGVWSTNDVTMTPGDQAGVGEGLQKQIWSVPRASDTKRFLRLRTVLTNQ